MIGNKTWQLTSHFDHTSTLHLPQIRWLLWCYCKSPSAHSHSTRNWDHAALPLKILKLASLNQSLQKIRKKIPSYYVVQCCKQVARVWFLNQIFRSYSVVIDARLTLCRYIATTFTTFKRSFEHLYIWLSIRIATLPRVNPVLSTLWQFFYLNENLLYFQKSGAAPH